MKRITLDSLQQKYAIRRSIVTELVRSGFILPDRGPRREYRFSFHDVVLLRMAQDLYDAGFSTRKLTRFLTQLADSLPARSVAGMRITAAGRELVVREDGRLRNAAGQLVIDFSQPAQEPAVHPLPARGSARKTGYETGYENDDRADHHFDLAESLVDTDPANAAEHYRRALELDPGMLDAWVNLGWLLLEAGDVKNAISIWRRGLVQHPDATLLHFNLGVACEEMELPEEALQCYRQALRTDPDLADAHYNAGRLADQLGRHTEAIRHFSAWRRLGRGQPVGYHWPTDNNGGSNG